MSAGKNLFDRFEEGFELGAGLRILAMLREEQARMRADLAQARQRGEHVHGRVFDAARIDDGHHLTTRRFGDAAIEAFLQRREIALEHDLGARR